MSKKKIVFIFGPTASGKTDLACRALKGIAEIISVDSMQVYRGLDLGTAKPDREQLEMVPHHLVNIVAPDYRFSAGDFRRLAIKAIDEISSRGKYPVLVGGTGLYFRALEKKLIEAPPADLNFRERLYEEEEKNPGYIYKKLREVDPEAAKKLNPKDHIRLVRALEIYHLTGKRFSEVTVDEWNTPSGSDYWILKIGVSLPREELYERIEKRCYRMVSRGLPYEVYELFSRGYDEKYPSMKGLGYSHYIQYFKGCIGYGEVIELFVRDSKRYAKRQMTWFRKERDVRWVGPDDHELVRDMIVRFFESND